MVKPIMILTLLLSSTLYPHGGRTNAEGYHNQRGGTYHCHGKKSKKKQSKSKKSTGQYNCQREYCKYMTSCDVAYYKLNTCGHSSLDRDRDGVPCENICSGG